ncbi:uncharacterized protein LOC134280063 [Saccostrea cucullata]|uniref:uncharacterized protein LOC134280063 n=1 Tax=Saccostrea cuccullata TaxID=36930 RepID=UPI002ED13381
MMLRLMRFTLAFYLIKLLLSTLSFVDCKNALIQRRSPHKKSCSETVHTIVRVTHCPSNPISLKSASLNKGCQNLPHSSCSEKAFVYHCVRFKDHLIEVCSPVEEILGQHCIQFNEGYGRVITDYNLHCSECPFTYNSSDFFKYQTCMEMIPAYLKTSSPVKQNNKPIASTDANVMAFERIQNVKTDQRDLEILPTKRTHTQRGENDRSKDMDAFWISSMSFLIPITVIVICLCTNQDNNEGKDNGEKKPESSGKNILFGDFYIL